MRDHKTRKLSVGRETLRRLEQDQLGRANGAGSALYQFCYYYPRPRVTGTPSVCLGLCPGDSYDNCYTGWGC